MCSRDHTVKQNPGTTIWLVSGRDVVRLCGRGARQCSESGRPDQSPVSCRFTQFYTILKGLDNHSVHSIMPAPWAQPCLNTNPPSRLYIVDLTTRFKHSRIDITTVQRAMCMLCTLHSLALIHTITIRHCIRYLLTGENNVGWIVYLYFTHTRAWFLGCLSVSL